MEEDPLCWLWSGAEVTIGAKGMAKIMTIAVVIQLLLLA
jgi:hypothetical protein